MGLHEYAGASMKQYNIDGYWTLVQQCIKRRSAVNRTLPPVLEEEAETAVIPNTRR
jgi:hypothetical protein